MGRPKTSAKILRLKGSFVAHPERAREDAEGAGEFDKEPPQHLPQECVRAWRWVVERLPLVAITKTEEIAVEMAARLLAQFWMSGSLDVAKELRQWLAKLGMTLADRVKLPAGNSSESKNRFSKFKD